jgi:predicted metal-dependent peptidase
MTETVTAKIDNDEFFAIADSLQDKHVIFHKFWEMGKPGFSDKIPTAGVIFNKEGEGMIFEFNPKFWNYLDDYSRRFVICHEMLHLILNHGVRMKGVRKSNRQAVNVCLDIVVNHLLVNKFGFNRHKIKGFEKDMLPEGAEPHGDYRDFCWVDTVFDPKRHPEMLETLKGRIPPDNKSFEYYYNLLPITPGGGGGEGDSGEGQGLGSDSFDDHDGLKDTEALKEIIEELNEDMTEEEKSDLEDMIDEHFQEEKLPKDGSGQGDQTAGVGAGGFWSFSKVDNVPTKKKWETIIKKWMLKEVKFASRDLEQWVRINRRFTILPNDFFLPTEMEVEDLYEEEGKIKVWFVIDNSGSCSHLFDRFAHAAASLPSDKFEVRLWCFDTMMHEVVITKGNMKALGGGGTAFDCIESTIQRVIKKEKCEYPKAVWVLTDSYGNHVNPQYPKHWFWFLTTNYMEYIPKECIDAKQVYDLRDFE